MAKTIHDLAVAYGKEHQGTVDIEVFEAGANAVLEEIVKSIFFNREYATKEDIFEAMTKKIEELKGE